MSWCVAAVCNHFFIMRACNVKQLAGFALLQQKKVAMELYIAVVFRFFDCQSHGTVLNAIL